MTTVGFESRLQLNKLKCHHLEKKKKEEKKTMCHPICKDGRIYIERNNSNKSSAITFATPRQKDRRSCEKEVTIFLLLI